MSVLFNTNTDSKWQNSAKPFSPEVLEFMANIVRIRKRKQLEAKSSSNQQDIVGP